MPKLTIIVILTGLVLETAYIYLKSDFQMLVKNIAGIHLGSLLFVFLVFLFSGFLQGEASWNLGLVIDAMLGFSAAVGFLLVLVYPKKKQLIIVVPIALFALVNGFVFNSFLIKKVFF